MVNQLVSTLGIVKISIGDALRYQLLQFPESHLTEQIKSYLMIGETIPEELCVAALERRMLEAEVNTRGYIVYGCIYVHTYVLTYICMCTYVHIYNVGTCVYVCVHTCVHISYRVNSNKLLCTPIVYKYRMVLDGWPQTKSQVELLRKHYILPMIFIELTVSEDECITRAYSQRLRRKR